MNTIFVSRVQPNLKILTEVFCLIKEQEVAAKFTVEQDRENALISLSRPLEAETFTLNLLFTSNMFQNEAAETGIFIRLLSLYFRNWHFLRNPRKNEFFFSIQLFEFRARSGSIFGLININSSNFVKIFGEMIENADFTRRFSWDRETRILNNTIIVNKIIYQVKLWRTNFENIKILAKFDFPHLSLVCLCEIPLTTGDSSEMEPSSVNLRNFAFWGSHNLIWYLNRMLSTNFERSNSVNFEKI